MDDLNPLSPLPPRLPRDKRRPYLSTRGASPDENLNGAAEFNRTGEHSIIGERIVCRHLALLYCECALKDPEFHPGEFYAGFDPREEDLTRLSTELEYLCRHSRAVHVLPSNRFGAFLRQAFTDLMHEHDRHDAVYMVEMPTHYMALRLRVKAKADGTQELVVQVYDPNKTKVHSVARVATPQDWDSEGQTHDFLSFVCTSEDTVVTRKAALDFYFTAFDPDANIILFELNADAEGDLIESETPGPLVTNWCTHSRVLMGLASELQDSDLLDAAVLSHFRHMEENHLDDPDLLLEVPDVDRSVLIYILFGANGVGQAQWEALWRRTQDMRLKVHLLRGENARGEHLLLSAELFDKDAMRWWLGLVATLPAKHILEVLAIPDQPYHPALGIWVSAEHSIAGSAWASILQAVRAHCASSASWLMAALSTDGVPLLAQYRNDAQLSIVHDWATLLPEVSDNDLVFLLQATDRAGFSALNRAIGQRKIGWIKWWGQWWSTAPLASRAELLCGQNPRGEHVLWSLARVHHPATFEAWRQLWRQLPEDQRADTLAANRWRAPRVSALHRAMSGEDSLLSDIFAGDVAFIRDWGACLAEVPPAQRMALLRGSPPKEAPALWQGLSTGHWAAVEAWANLLHWVTPSERESLTALPTSGDHPLAQAVRQQVRRDAAGFREALQALDEASPGGAIDWLHALAPNH